MGTMLMQVQSGAPMAQPITVAVSEREAMRQVGGFTLRYVSHLVAPETSPVLVVEPDRAFWRVPISYRSTTAHGQVGTIDVDAQTGVFDRSLVVARNLFRESCRLAGITGAALDEAMSIWEPEADEYPFP
jgi:hypothetical protein